MVAAHRSLTVNGPDLNVSVLRYFHLQYCCVPSCSSDARYASGKDKSFHHFPKDPARKKLWIIKIRRE